MDRAKFYSNRVLNGTIENIDSGERSIATGLFDRKIKVKAKKKKFDKQFAKMTYMDDLIEIDFTTNKYEEIWDNVVRINEIRIRNMTIVSEEMMTRL